MGSQLPSLPCLQCNSQQGAPCLPLQRICTTLRHPPRGVLLEAVVVKLLPLLPLLSCQQRRTGRRGVALREGALARNRAPVLAILLPSPTAERTQQRTTLMQEVRVLAKPIAPAGHMRPLQGQRDSRGLGHLGHHRKPPQYPLLHVVRTRCTKLLHVHRHMLEQWDVPLCILSSTLLRHSPLL
jgi:hypothetical protein